MISLLDPNAQLVAILLLLILSLVTLEYCRRDRGNAGEDESAFLFKGKSALHSLASNTGSIFSLTYFFGGVVIYGHVFGLSYLAAAVLVVAISLALLWRLIAQVGAAGTLGARSSNALLDCLQERLTPVDFRVVVRLYSIIYFLLLIEELAVSRLAITMMLPSHPAMSALALGLICIVIFTYLKLGGFRAVLNSDLVQMGIIAAFMLALVFLVAKSHSLPDTPSRVASTTARITDVASMAMALLFGVSWFIASVDFFSRLNFSSDRVFSATRQRQVFAAVSLFSVLLVITIGILYGIHLRGTLTSVDSSTVYSQAVIAHFLTLDRPFISALFVVALFCMIFTTIDTLLLTLVQIDTYRGTRWLRRESLAGFLLVAVGLSCLIEFELVPAFGIFAGSLMILPAIAIAKTMFSSGTRLAPPRLAALEWALLGAGILFVVFAPGIKTEFAKHYLLPAIVLASAAVATTAGHVAFKLRGRR